MTESKTAGVPCEAAPDMWMSEGPRSQARAKAICLAECPARAREGCLREALDRPEQWGVWGGLTTQELKELSRSLNHSKGPKSRRVA